MNINDLIAHIMLNISKHTREFSQYLAINSATALDDRYIHVVADNHGLVSGKSVIFEKGEVKNLISDIQISNGFATITFLNEHDFVLFDDDEKLIELGGFADSSWNGKHELINVPSRLMIEIKSPGASVPIFTNSYIWENRSMGVNGLFEIVEILSDGFKAKIPEFYPNLPNNEIRNLEIISGFRICGVADEQRSIEIWNETDKNNSWLFIMFPDDIVSRSNEAESDAVATFAPGDDGRLRILENVDISAIIPTKTTGGADAVFKANGEIRRALISTIFGIKNNNEPGKNRVYGAVYNGSTQSVYNTAVYIRVYSFQMPYDITFENADISNPQTVAFRDILLEMAISENKNADTFKAEINLDEKQ